MRFIFFNKPNNVPKVTGIHEYLCERLGLVTCRSRFRTSRDVFLKRLGLVSWHGRLGLVVQRLVYIPATYIEINWPSCILNAASWILNKRVNGNIEKGSK